MSELVDNLAQQGGLGKYVADIMQRAGDRIPSQLEERDTAQQNYLSQLSQPIDSTPSDIQKYAQMAEAFSSNPTMPMTGLSRALQAYGQGTSAQDLAARQRADQAAQIRARMGQDNVKSSIDEMKSLGTLAKISGATGISPEKLNSVYNGARNEAAQIAKDYSFQSAEERSSWIEQQANNAVENYIARFSTSGGGYGAQRPPVPVGGAPTVTPPGAPAVAPNAPAVAPNVPGRPAPVPQVTPPDRRDRAEEARQKEFATKSEELALKDYDENVKVPAQSAESMLNTIGMIRQIPRTQDMFAPWREKLGSAMDAMGMDGKMAREAQNLQQIRPLLSKMANDRLMMAKGTQTEGDAQRAYNEFIKISDTQQAVDFMMTWAEELANRAKFKDQVYRMASEKEGSMKKGKDWWDKTDYAQVAPVAILNNKPYSFTKWRDAFLTSNPGAELKDAIAEWNKLTRRK